MTTAPHVDAHAESRWIRCPGCHDLVYAARFLRGRQVCPGCGHHEGLTAQERLDMLLDPGSAVPVDAPSAVRDPLGFADAVPYAGRLAGARERTGLDEAVTCVRATIDRRRVVVAAMDFRFLGGSLGCEVGARITAAAETALAERATLVLITASGGARMQEGALSLMQMAKTTQALAALGESGVLTITLATDPTYGGVAASYATQADIVLAEPGARMGFAGPRVIEQTIGQRLPDGFQTAEFLLANGLIDDVRPRPTHRSVIAHLAAAGVSGSNQAAWREARPYTRPPLIRDPGELPVRDPWDIVRAARDVERPTSLDYAGHLLDGFHELHGDRATGDCPAIVGGIGWLNGKPLMLIGHQKGHSTRELVARRFGMASPAGYRKAARLLRLAERLGMPVLTLIDTPGAHPGIEAEERGQMIAIAENLRVMSGLAVPTVAVVTGEGGSGGALALGVADRVLALSNGVYSVISPEGCAAILWRDSAAAPRAAAALRMTAADLLAQRVIDGVVLEPDGGAAARPAVTAAALRDSVEATLVELSRLEVGRLLRERRARFRAFGVPHI